MNIIYKNLIEKYISNLTENDIRNYAFKHNEILTKEETNIIYNHIKKYYKELLNKELSLKELNNYPIILQSIGSNTRAFLDNFTKEHNIILKPNMELASYSLVVEFARIGLGIGYVTENYIKDDLNNKRLYKLKLKEKIPERYIGIALSKNNIPNFSTKKMIEIITKK